MDCERSEYRLWRWGGFGKGRLRGASQSARLRSMRFCCKASSPLPRRPRPSPSRAALVASRTDQGPAPAPRAAVLSGITVFAAFWRAPLQLAPPSRRLRRFGVFPPALRRLSCSRLRPDSRHARLTNIILPRAVLRKTADRARRSPAPHSDPLSPAWRDFLPAAGP